MDSTAILILVIVVPLVGSLFAVAKILTAYWLKKHLQDQELADQLSNALNNGLGAVQQGINKMIIPANPSITASVPRRLVPGVQYVINNAEQALERWPMSPEKIAEKIVAKEGLQEIANNLAVSGSADPVAVPPMTPAAETARIVSLKESSSL